MDFIAPRHLVVTKFSLPPSFGFSHIFLLIIAYLIVTQSCATEIVLNDVHSQLNATHVERIHYPTSIDEISKIIIRAKQQGKSISISGSRHAMGGQQFGKGTIHISMSKFIDIIELDDKRGIVRVEAGIEWPELVNGLLNMQKNAITPWTIRQKQTGADRLSIGGALSANIHGRGVKFKPFVQDVEAFTLINAEGDVLNVSREENAELFSLVIGGYGLFGVIATVDLRLVPRAKLERVVEIVSLSDLQKKVNERLENGFIYGDFQYKTDSDAPDFMSIGVLSAYKPVSHDTPILNNKEKLTRSNWYRLLELAHTNKAAAFDLYSQYYLTTNNQIYWSDLHQMSEYLDDHMEYLQHARPELSKGSLMITELYVPRDKLQAFIQNVVKDNKQHSFDIVYGTLRLIEKDDETYLPWAKQDYACVIINLRVEWSNEGKQKAKNDFRRLIDHALDLDGSYFLTYHRWARKDQVLRAYPQFVDFLRLKLKYDPEERFQSDWYRYYRDLFQPDVSLPNHRT